MRKIMIADDTLKTLTKEQAAPLLFREKTALAAGLVAAGVDAIELAPVKNVKEDTIIYKTIASVVRGCAVCLPVGNDPDGTETAWNCISRAEKPCLQVSVPVSAVRMEYGCGLKEDGMLARIRKQVSEAAGKCGLVEFIAEDATRADAEFLKKAVSAAESAGAKVITVCDDCGDCMPEELLPVIRNVLSAVSVPVYVKTNDRISFATANALAALRAGCQGVKTSVCGKDALLTEKFAEAFFAKAEILDMACGLKRTALKSSIDAMLKSIGKDAEQTGTERSEKDIFLDASALPADVGRAVEILGYDLSAEDIGRVHDALIRICEKKSSVGAKELEAIVASSAMQAPSAYHLENYMITTGSSSAAMAHISLSCEGDTLNGIATGDGPIDSAFRAIEQSIGCHYELDDFQIQAVTEGKESLGSALVRLRSGGRLYSGNGISADIVGASIRAYINALNKIVAEENRT